MPDRRAASTVRTIVLVAASYLVTAAALLGRSAIVGAPPFA